MGAAVRVGRRGSGVGMWTHSFCRSASRPLSSTRAIFWWRLAGRRGRGRKGDCLAAVAFRPAPAAAGARKLRRAFTSPEPPIMLSLLFPSTGAMLVGAPATRVPTQASAVRAMAPQMALEVDLKGKVAFVAGVADSTGYGWATATGLNRLDSTDCRLRVESLVRSPS